VALGACNKEEDTVWVQFNADDDTLGVDITASEDLGEAREGAVTSTSGTVELGYAIVTPGSGPVGTDHEITVDVYDEWEDLVERVSVRLDAGARGVDEYDLQRDSADHGHWWIELTSVGSEGEERTDTLTVRLWEEVLEGDVPSTVEETSTTGS
jgi:hypothetical protein